MAISRAQLLKELLPGLNALFGLEYTKYEDEHADLLSSFIEQHSNPHCDVIIVDPGRSSRAKFCKKMTDLDFSHYQQKFVNPAYLFGD